MDPMYTEYFIRLAIAMVLGIAIGTERVFAHKVAGMRTYALVSIGAALFSITSHVIYNTFYLGTQFNPSAIPAAVVTGIGFLGTGLMIWRQDHLYGLTTATGFWICAAIGIACGFGLFPLAIFATILTLFVFAALWSVENMIKKFFIKKSNTSSQEEQEI